MSITNECPIIIAGDIFDDGWRPIKCPPELINFVINELGQIKQPIYAIPGQHDLPYHRYEDIKKSAYWTLVQAGVIENLNPGMIMVGEHFRLYGYPWGLKPNYNLPLEAKNDGRVNIAVVHDYCWKDGHSFPGAPPDKHVDDQMKLLQGFDTVVFGDNHIPWIHYSLGASYHVINCGTFIRRHRDDTPKPRVHFIFDGGRVGYEFLNTAQDKPMVDIPASVLDKKEFNADELLEMFTIFRDVKLDFKQVLEQYMLKSKTPDAIKEIILTSLS